METLEQLKDMAERYRFVPSAPAWVPVGVTGHLTRGRYGQRVIIRFDALALQYHVEGLIFATMADALAHVASSVDCRGVNRCS